MAADILGFVKTNIFWIIFFVLVLMCLFILIKLIPLLKNQLKKKNNKLLFQPENISGFDEEIKKSQIEVRKIQPEVKKEIKPITIKQEIPAVKKPAYYNIPAIQHHAKMQKKEIIQIPKNIVSYSEVKEGDRKKMQEEIKKLKKEIREKERENNRKTVIQKKEAKPVAKKVKKETSKKAKKKVVRKKK
jgi:hypothetical protein